jgi:hypothetical protein
VASPCIIGRIDPAADHKRRDGMAMAAAAYLHPRLSTIDAKLEPPAAELPERSIVQVEFVVPGARPTPG